MAQMTTLEEIRAELAELDVREPRVELEACNLSDVVGPCNFCKPPGRRVDLDSDCRSNAAIHWRDRPAPAEEKALYLNRRHVAGYVAGWLAAVPEPIVIRVGREETSDEAPL